MEDIRDIPDSVEDADFDYEGGTTVRDQYSNYITKKLSIMYKKKIIPVAIFLAFLIIMAVVTPIVGMYLPKDVTGDFSPESYYQDGQKYVRATFDNLYFTGYTTSWLGKTTGYYYYTVMDDGCYIVLVNPEDCKQGLPTLENFSMRCQIRKRSATEGELLNKLSNDLECKESSLTNTISLYVLSQPGATGFRCILFMVVYGGCFIFALICLILHGIYIFFPGLAPAVQALRPYGKPSVLLAQAEEEVATLPQLATEDMFITEHYFVETSSYGVAIVPIDKILWIYKYSTLHKILWHHFAISYTLHITADKRQYIKCPKNDKSDIDGVIEYLAEANHNILVGFSEENRQAVSEMHESSWVKDLLGRFKW